MWSKYIILILLCVFVAACDPHILTKYSVVADGSFSILTDAEEVATNYWSKDVFSSGNVEIYVKPITASEIDVRVLYIANNGIETYAHIVDSKPILIKGVIHPLP